MTAKNKTNRRPQTPKARAGFTPKRGNNGAEPRGPRYNRAQENKGWK